MRRALRSFRSAVLLWTMSSLGTAPHAARRGCEAQRGPHRCPPAPTTAYHAVLDKYCVTCHNERAKTGGLTLESIARASIPEHADVWEKAVRKLRAGTMPPPGMPRPDRRRAAGMIAWLETALDRAAAARPNPGRPALHRLNRAEYANAIRDLLALDVDVSSLLPPDDSSFGFDNMADVLGVSPVLLERYLSAAEKISALAVGDPSIVPGDETYRVRYDLHADRTHRGAAARHARRPADRPDVSARRRVRHQAEAVADQRRASSAASHYPHQVEITVDGERVHLVTVGDAGGLPDRR